MILTIKMIGVIFRTAEMLFFFVKKSVDLLIPYRYTVYMRGAQIMSKVLVPDKYHYCGAKSENLEEEN